jgi:hypothetical protein
MELNEVIALDQIAEPPVRKLLESSGGRLYLSVADWILPSTAAASVKTELTRRGVPFELFFAFEPAAGESPDEIAAFVPITDFEHLEQNGRRLVLAVDLRTRARIASAELVRVLEPLTSGVTWTASEDHEGMLALTDAPHIPDPVVVPRAIDLSETAGGIWSVRSDGRELLTHASLRLVREAGIALTPQFTTEGRTLPWYRPPIFGGRVLDALRGLDVNGIVGPPVYLGQTADGA